MIRAGKLKPRSLGFAIAGLLSFAGMIHTHQAIAQSISPSEEVKQPEKAVSVEGTTPEGMTDLEKAIVEEANRLRTNPSAYVAELQNLRKYYNDKVLELPGQPRLTTSEGVSAVDEAIRAIGATRPLPPLQVSRGLYFAARDHANDIGPKGKDGHDGSDGSDPFKRMNRYGTWGGNAAENINFSSSQEAKMHIMDWLIDDGVTSRGHREALLNPSLKLTGVACGAHKTFGQVCVMTYSAEYTEKSAQANR